MDELKALLDRDLVVDVHFHVGASAARFRPERRFAFETPADSDGHASFLSPRIVKRFGWRVAGRLFGLAGFRPGEDLDRRMESIILSHVESSPSVDRVVALAFDLYHTNEGHPVGAAVRRTDRASDLYVSNSFVWELCQRHPERFLFGASIHPYRPGALDALEQVAAAGAVLVKWLPLVQNIGISDARSAAFVRRAAELAMPMLIHYGGEKALANAHPELGDPQPLFDLLAALRRQAVRPTIIIAHVAVGTNWPVRFRGYIRETIAALIGPHHDDHLYADTAAGALFSRAHWLKRLARMPHVHGKLLFGTDFPVPPTPLCFRRQLGERYAEVAALPSIIEQNYRIKQALGFDREFFHRAWAILREGLRHRMRGAT